MTTARNRNRYISYSISTRNTWNSSSGSWNPDITQSLPTEYEWCDDVIGNYGGLNTLLITKRDRILCSLTGQNGAHRLNGWEIPRSQINRNNDPGFNANQLALELKARTNPSKPHIALPVSVFELRDIVLGIRREGVSKISALEKLMRKRKSIKRRGVTYTYASLNLAIQFGLAPLIADVKKLMAFDQALERRTDEVNRLFDEGGLRKKQQLGTWSHTEEGSIETILSNPSAALTRATPTTLTEAKYWGTVRWKPTASIAKLSDSERRDLVHNILLGLDGSQVASNVWNALPWSWLIDWGTNVSTWLTANNNRLAYTSGMLPIMRETTATQTWKINSSPSWATVNPSTPKIQKTWKERFIASPASVTATLPVLNAQQLSILGSISITRSRPFGG